MKKILYIENVLQFNKSRQNPPPPPSPNKKPLLADFYFLVRVVNAVLNTYISILTYNFSTYILTYTYIHLYSLHIHIYIQKLSIHTMI